MDSFVLLIIELKMPFCVLAPSVNCFYKYGIWCIYFITEWSLWKSASCRNVLFGPPKMPFGTNQQIVVFMDNCALIYWNFPFGPLPCQRTDVFFNVALVFHWNSSFRAKDLRQNGIMIGAKLVCRTKGGQMYRVEASKKCIRAYYLFTGCTLAYKILVL